MARFKFKAVAPSGQVVEGEMVAPGREQVIDRLRKQQHLPVRVDEVGQGELGRVEPIMTTPPEIASERPEPEIGRVSSPELEPAEPQLDEPKPDSPAQIIALRVERNWGGEERRQDPQGKPPPRTGERRKKRRRPVEAETMPAEPRTDWPEVEAQPEQKPEPRLAGKRAQRWQAPAEAAEPAASAPTPVAPVQPSAPPATRPRQDLGEARYRGAETLSETAPDGLSEVASAVLSAEPAETLPGERSEAAPRKAKRARAAMPAKLQPVFTRELQVLLSAGLPVDHALKIIVESTADDRVAAAADTLLTRVRGGAVLSEAMDTMPEQFDEFLRTAIRAGEAGGALAEVLDQVAAYQERGARLVRAFRTALIYPAILAFAAALSVILLLTLVVPQFDALFKQAGQTPPLVTRAVIAASTVLRQYGWVVPAAGFAAWLLGKWRYGGVMRRARMHRRALRLPLIGNVLAGVAVERFARSMATLLANGVPLPTALQLVADTLPNRAVGAVVAASVERVKQGERLADALEEGRVLPLLAVQLIRVGEEGGRLTEMLARLSAIYAADVDVAVRRLIAFIEPALILAIGVVVGGIILSLLAAVTGVNALAQ